MSQTLAFEIFLIGLILFCLGFSIKALQTPKSTEDLMVAMAVLASKEAPNNVIGPFDLTRNYWANSGIPDGQYEDCRQIAYSKRVILSYWQKHCPMAYRHSDLQVLARVHKGGPNGDKNQATLPYWRLIEVEMNNN